AGENGGGIADPGGDGYGGHGSEPRCVFAWQLTRSCCLAPALFVNLHRPKKGYFETVPTDTRLGSPKIVTNFNPRRKSWRQQTHGSNAAKKGCSRRTTASSRSSTSSRRCFSASPTSTAK